MKEVKVGIIGTGFMGPVHIEALRRLGFVKIKALAEANEELAKERAAEFNIDKYYGDSEYAEKTATPGTFLARATAATTRCHHGKSAPLTQL